eukprot:COSAG01_NODE_25647_length_738_cov_1.305164_2_plen_111_part_01
MCATAHHPRSQPVSSPQRCQSCRVVYCHALHLIDCTHVRPAAAIALRAACFSASSRLSIDLGVERLSAEAIGEAMLSIIVSIDADIDMRREGDGGTPLAPRPRPLEAPSTG